VSGWMSRRVGRLRVERSGPGSSQHGQRGRSGASRGVDAARESFCRCRRHPPRDHFGRYQLRAYRRSAGPCWHTARSARGNLLELEGVALAVLEPRDPDRADLRAPRRRGCRRTMYTRGLTAATGRSRSGRPGSERGTVEAARARRIERHPRAVRPAPDSAPRGAPDDGAVMSGDRGPSNQQVVPRPCSSAGRAGCLFVKGWRTGAR